MKPILALSTSWCSQRHSDGYAMLQEMADLGFEYVELSHGIRILLLPGILQAVEEGVIQVSSTHNFCPLPAGVLKAAPNLFEPSNTDPREHQQWLRQTKRSLDFARQVKARALVCHLGSVVFFWFNPGAKLRAYWEKHPGLVAAAEDKPYQRKLARALAKIRRRMPPYWARTQASVKEILGYAAEQGVSLGLENREKFEELPIDADFPEFLASLPAGAARRLLARHRPRPIEAAAGDDRPPRASGEKRFAPDRIPPPRRQRRGRRPSGRGQRPDRFQDGEHVLASGAPADSRNSGPRATVDDVRASKERLEALIG